jgi:uncharacterized coiled-coil DUF342 family protein
MQEIHTMLETMIRDLRKENNDAHSEIVGLIRSMDRDVSQLKEWRARILGVAAALSATISATAWAATKLFGG